MRKILVPFDFSVEATDAFRFALRLEKETKSEVHLLHVIELPALYDTVLMPALSFEEENLQDIWKNAEHRLEHVTKKYSSPEVKLKTKVEFGSTYRMILDYSETKWTLS